MKAVAVPETKPIMTTDQGRNICPATQPPQPRETSTRPSHARCVMIDFFNYSGGNHE